MFRVKNHDSDTIQNYYIVIGIFVLITVCSENDDTEKKSSNRRVGFVKYLLTSGMLCTILAKRDWLLKLKM